jgi:hypothetical protein
MCHCEGWSYFQPEAIPLMVRGLLRRAKYALLAMTFGYFVKAVRIDAGF